MRTPFVAGNWKMFKTVHEAVLFAKELRPLVKDIVGVDIVVAQDPEYGRVHYPAQVHAAELRHRSRT